jgi:YggT family protein
MFVLANLLSALAQVLSILINALMWIIIIRALISWVNPDPGNIIVQVLYSISEPFLAPVRRLLPFSLRFGLDLSPLIVALVLYFLQSFLIKTLFDLSWKIRYS